MLFGTLSSFEACSQQNKVHLKQTVSVLFFFPFFVCLEAQKNRATKTGKHRSSIWLTHPKKKKCFIAIKMS